MRDIISKDQSKTIAACLIILAATAITTALIYTQTVLVPFIFSVFIYAIFSPSIKWFEEKCKFPRMLAIALTIIIALSAIGFLSFFIFSSFEKFFSSAHSYWESVLEFTTWATDLLTRWGWDIEKTPIQKTLQELQIFSLATNITGNVFTFLGNATLILIFVLFLLIGEGASEVQNPLFLEIQEKVSQYVSKKVLTSVTTGVIVGLVLKIVDVDLAFLFAILTIFLNFIPTIGSIIATLLPLPVVLLQFGFGWQFILVLTLTGSTQFVIGSILEPKMMGEAMDLHPVIVLLFLMFWGLVWGIAGMFLAVPITAVLKIILNRIPATKPLAEILAGRLPI